MFNVVCNLPIRIWCCNFAHLILGCTLNFRASHTMLSSIKTNTPLINLYIENTKSLGVEYNDEEERKTFMASTDMGNVSQIIPSIYPLFKIKTAGANHTHEFTKGTGLDENQLPTLNSAKGMAMTVIDVMCKPNLMEAIKKDFKK